MTDPFAAGFPGGFDPRMFENVPLFRELFKVMSWTGGPVNWDLASQTALAITAPSGDDVVGERDESELGKALSVAELWLDQVTGLSGIEGPVRAFSRAAWVRLACTPDGLGVYVEPVAEGMTAALRRQMPEEMHNLGGALSQAMVSMGAMLYGVQIGTIAGHLAGQLLTTYDLGVPTIDPRTAGTIGTTARQFAADYDFDQLEFVHWMALREAAHRRQYAGIRWLRPHLAELIRRFAEEAEFDPSRMLEQFGGLGLDPTEGITDPSALREALESSGASLVEPTAAQLAVLEELQALVAFTQSWVDHVVATAAENKLPSLPRIEEALRRRRAEKGPGERFLEQLVGLDLQPKDLRAGRAFCQAVTDARGQEGLDRAWRSADYLPRPEELIEPSRWLVRMAAAELEDGSAP